MRLRVYAADNIPNRARMNKVRREAWVDMAKGIGIVLVVYGHIAWGVCNAGLGCDRARETTVHSVLYSFHMPLFFFLAGLFLKRSLLSHGGPGGLVLNKVKTVAYPYAVWSLLQGGVEILFSRFKNTGAATWQDILSFPWEPRMQLWFLFTLFWTFVVAGWALSKVPARHQAWLLVPALLAYAAKDQFRDINNLYNLANFMPFFLLGAWFVDHAERVLAHSRLIFVVSLLAALGMEWVFHAELGLQAEGPGHPLKFPLALVCIAAVISLCHLIQQFQPRHGRWLGMLGAASMVIYTMHTMIGVAVRAALAGGLHSQDFALHTAVGTLVAILLPLLIHQRFAKWVRYLYEPPRFLSLGAWFPGRSGKPSA